MTTYELLIIHSPLLTDEQYQEQMTRLKDLVARHGGEIKKEDLWGKRRLAYPIEKQREGHYAILHFDTASDSLCLPELERFCKIEETVLRHLVTRAVLNKSLGTPPEPRSFDDAESRSGRGREGGEGRSYARSQPQPEPAPAPESAPAPVADAEPEDQKQEGAASRESES